MREIVVFTRIVHRLGLDLSRRSTARRRRSAIAFDSPKTIFELGFCGKQIERVRRRWSRSPRTASIWLPTDCRSLPYYTPDVVETNTLYFLLPPIQTAFLPTMADPNREIAYVRYAAPRTYRHR
ncbi:uncharacterized protein LOC121601771 [Anopheles merus]|uniref:uncharacterized protein LOC121601771 n=1 Tax=Anopheles merus TaxID=30066 RepID=UPI001BE46A97|nr:uncharacterized protein LOC121601771 [Anopheles merus]